MTGIGVCTGGEIGAAKPQTDCKCDTRDLIDGEGLGKVAHRVNDWSGDERQNDSFKTLLKQSAQSLKGGRCP